MKINIDDNSQLLSHVLLADKNVCEVVADTENWINNGNIICTVQFNGVECPAEVLENVLQNFIKYIEKQVDYDKFEQKVEERAKEIIQEHADNVIDKMQDLLVKLQESDDLIKPHWER